MGFTPEKGMLYLCATPIGNMEDITLRTLDCLKQADYIAVESIERSSKLLYHYGIKKPLISYREENRERKNKEIIGKIKEGAVIALITDAGMPGISDPGFNLLNLMVEKGLSFTIVPGPSAALTALLLSGYFSYRFVFWGFLNRKKKKRMEELESISREEKTVIMYESPYRLGETLAGMADMMNERELAVCREMTKKFEEVKRGSPSYLKNYFHNFPPRGEITLVLSPLDTGGKKAGELEEENSWNNEDIKKMLREEMQKGKTSKESVYEVKKMSGWSKNKVYSLLVQLKEEKYQAE